MSNKKKLTTLAQMLKKRDEIEGSLCDVDKHIREVLGRKCSRPLCKVRSNKDIGIGTKNNTLSLTWVNGNHFCFTMAEGRFTIGEDVNVTPEDFRRFLAGCAELYDVHVKHQRRERRASKLRIVRGKLNKKLARLEGE